MATTFHYEEGRRTIEVLLSSHFASCIVRAWRQVVWTPDVA